MRLDPTKRSVEAEWLDQPGLDPQELEEVLGALARFNRIFLGHRPILRWVRMAMSFDHNGPITLVDVGCGYGDLLRAIRKWGLQHDLNMNLIGVDLNPETVRIARSVTSQSEQIQFRVANAFDLDVGVPIDLMICSLVTHHMEDAEISDLITLMDQQSHRGWAICDLQRSRSLYHLLRLAGLLTRTHPIVIRDGQTSVMRSLTRAEWVQRVFEAGVSLEDVQIRWFFFRFLISRLK
jgi:SAM-dependent methyltransferase